ncbi:hypothetical protein GALMADRAFT_246565 [Galerina marginata CBS 339.88]|uniref:Uncharacterized protein n=1 Tax=Galerina marginata (strain CBS 339.88) TaxID=685588 RepID=A0A067T291_GALM3|nr:hypothetical protein GALMADRAFT_246565 [Galerina marginata CBS 339.88]
MQRPQFFGAREDPIDALCHHFNLRQTTPPTGTALGPSFDMRVTRDAHMPTHVLAVTQTDQQPSTPPLMLPIDRSLFERAFRNDLNFPLAYPGSIAPIPRLVSAGDSQPVLMVSLPVVPIPVPHIRSLALLLLFGMGLETDLNLLSWNLLPVNVVEEFPNAAAMSLVLSRKSDDRFESIYKHNQGLWRNILALGLTDTRILELVHTAWNVTAEARRIRQRSSSRQM